MRAKNNSKGLLQARERMGEYCFFVALKVNIFEIQTRPINTVNVLALKSKLWSTISIINKLCWK